MWMCYAEGCDSVSEVADLNDAVTRLQCTLERLAFDADHEAVYGCERFFTISECTKLAESYNCAYNNCERYLNGKINIDILVCRLQELGLTRFIFDLEKFLPPHLQEYLAKISGDDICYGDEMEIKGGEAEVPEGREEKDDDDDDDAVPRPILQGEQEEDDELKACQ